MKSTNLVANIMLFVLLILFQGCEVETKESYTNLKSKPTAEYSPDFVIEWWKLIYEHVAYQRVKPPVASRIYAYIGVSAYEAGLPGMPENQTLEGRLEGLENLPRPDQNLEYDWPTVMIQSLYLTTDELLSRFIHASETDFVDLRDKQLAERKAELSEDVFTRSSEYGEKLAEALTKWIVNDKFADTRFYTFYEIPSRNDNPEFWEPTEPNSEPCEPYWSTLRPFFLESGEQCDIALKVPFSPDEDSDFRKHVDEILEFDANMTEDQRDIAFHWADDPGETSTPPGHWTYIMNYAINQEDLNLAEATSIYAMVGVGIADAFIASWYTKYKVNLLRPKTYVQEYMNIPDWEPLVETPPFPEYTSAHSVVSTVASELLTSIFGEDYTLIDSTHVQIGLEPRKITSFRDAALEASLSRVYGGLHYRFAIEAGIEQGQCVKDQILNKIQLRKDGTLNFIQK